DTLTRPVRLALGFTFVRCCGSPRASSPHGLAAPGSWASLDGGPCVQLPLARGGSQLAPQRTFASNPVPMPGTPPARAAALRRQSRVQARFLARLIQPHRGEHTGWAGSPKALRDRNYVHEHNRRVPCLLSVARFSASSGRRQVSVERFRKRKASVSENGYRKPVAFLTEISPLRAPSSCPAIPHRWGSVMVAASSVAFAAKARLGN